MANRELLEWLGITFADLLVYGALAALAGMFLVSDSTADLILALLGVSFSLAACPVGMKRDPKFSELTNDLKLVSYPLCVILAIGTIIVHYIWFNK